jgi:hypothetical protein
VIVYVLGAPGSGKSTIACPLRELLAACVVFDWDGLMGPAGTLAGADIRATPATWRAYGLLVRAVVDQIAPTNLVLLGVCTPDELSDWPTGQWILLDSSDDERSTRLALREDAEQIEYALQDAAHARSLGLSAVDSTGLALPQAAEELANRIKALIE